MNNLSDSAGTPLQKQESSKITAVYLRAALGDTEDLDRQSEQISLYVRTREDLDSVHYYGDMCSGHVKSGPDAVGRIPRPGLTKLIHDIKCGKVRALYVASLDRIAAGCDFLCEFFELCGEHGTAIYADGTFLNAELSTVMNIAPMYLPSL